MPSSTHPLSEPADQPTLLKGSTTGLGTVAWRLITGLGGKLYHLVTGQSDQQLKNGDVVYLVGPMSVMYVAKRANGKPVVMIVVPVLP